MGSPVVLAADEPFCFLVSRQFPPTRFAAPVKDSSGSARQGRSSVPPMAACSGPTRSLKPTIAQRELAGRALPRAHPPAAPPRLRRPSPTASAVGLCVCSARPVNSPAVSCISTTTLRSGLSGFPLRSREGLYRGGRICRSLGRAGWSASRADLAPRLACTPPLDVDAKRLEDALRYVRGRLDDLKRRLRELADERLAARPTQRPLGVATDSPDVVLGGLWALADGSWTAHCGRFQPPSVAVQRPPACSRGHRHRVGEGRG